MKKFLLSLCVLAMASVCVFMTSCKDEDGNEKDYVTQVNSNVAKKIAAAENTAVYTYKYTMNGQTYNTAEELQEAIKELPVGTQAEVQVIATPKAGGTVLYGKKTTFTVPTQGNQISVTFNVPVAENADGSAKEEAVKDTIGTTMTYQHSGGQVK